VVAVVDLITVNQQERVVVQEVPTLVQEMEFLQLLLYPVPFPRSQIAVVVEEVELTLNLSLLVPVDLVSF
jgi:hypothetical protein|tara:strand:+ start:1273 stop:1482 length:210 start_codon:yes stop_codon:yes gene_type:complete